MDEEGELDRGQETSIYGERWGLMSIFIDLWTLKDQRDRIAATAFYIMKKTFFKNLEMPLFIGFIYTQLL